jgi:hypothetical protein
MDTKAGTKTYVKVPWLGETIRSRPFEDRHLTAITMAQQMRDETRQINVVLRVLTRLLDDDVYERITNDFVDGNAASTDLTGLLHAIVQATVAYKTTVRDQGLDVASTTLEPAVPDTFRAEAG